MSRISLWILVFCATLMVGFLGCRSFTPAVTYYFMSPMTAGSVSTAAAEGSRTTTIGIRNVELPGYVNRPQMVKRTGKNQLELVAFHRWADYPDRMVPGVLGENLQLLMPHARVYRAPWSANLKPDVTVDLTFLELTGTTDNMMLLNAIWTITAKGDPQSARSGRTVLSEAMPGSGYDDLAAAHSHALESLCREIAQALKDVSVR